MKHLQRDRLDVNMKDLDFLTKVYKFHGIENFNEDPLE
jgi:hypothetical protein